MEDIWEKWAVSNRSKLVLSLGFFYNFSLFLLLLCALLSNLLVSHSFNTSFSFKYSLFSNTGWDKPLWKVKKWSYISVKSLKRDNYCFLEWEISYRGEFSEVSRILRVLLGDGRSMMDVWNGYFGDSLVELYPTYRPSSQALPNLGIVHLLEIILLSDIFEVLGLLIIALGFLTSPSKFIDVFTFSSSLLTSGNYFFFNRLGVHVMD